MAELPQEPLNDPIDPTRRPPEADEPISASVAETLGAPGTAIVGGFLVEGEKDSALTGRAKYLTYSDILANTNIVGAGVRFFLNMVARASWKVQPKGDTEEAKRLADLCYDILHTMETPWHRIVRRAAMYRFYGFSVQEWVAKRREDGVIGFRDIYARPQLTIEKWDTDAHGRVLGVVQSNPQNSESVYLPRAKLVYLVDDVLNDSPEGVGLFRHIVKAARRLDVYELLEGWGYETDLRGIPIARAPLAKIQQLVSEKKITEAQARALRAPLEQFVSKHSKSPSLGMVLDSSVYRSEGEQKQPSGSKLWDLELMQGDQGPHAEIAQAIERLNREIARVLGVENMLLGGSDRGSHAMSEDKSITFGAVADSVLAELQQQFRRDLLVPLFKLNGWDMELLPTFRTDSLQHRDYTALTKALESLSRAGAVLLPDDPAINEIRSLMGLSNAPDADLDLLGEKIREAYENGSVVPGMRNAQPLKTGGDAPEAAPEDAPEGPEDRGPAAADPEDDTEDDTEEEEEEK